MNDQRPALFELGLLLSALHAGLWIAISLFGGLLVGLGVGAAALIHPLALFPAGFLGGLTGIVVGITIAWSLLTIFACHASWSGSRGWTWALLFITVAGLTDLGLLSTPIRLLTLVGIAQWLSSSRQPDPQAARA